MSDPKRLSSKSGPEGVSTRAELPVSAYRRRLLLLPVAALGTAACSGGGSGDAADAGNDLGPTDTPQADGSDDVLDDVPVDLADVPPGCDGFDFGPISDFPPDSRRLLMTPFKVVVLRDATSIWAFDGACRHFGGNIVPSPRAADRSVCDNCNGSCSLHGTVYDNDGRNLVGPAGGAAQVALNSTPFAVCVMGGRVLISRQSVPRGTRTAVP